MDSKKLLELAELCEAGKELTDGEMWEEYGLPIKRPYHCWNVKSISKSLDAVAALEKELLPDWYMVTGVTPVGAPMEHCFCERGSDTECQVRSEAPTEPLARLAALLKALAETKGTE